MSRPITAMHNVIPAATVADMQPDNFRRVTITHAVYADTSDMKTALAERSSGNAVMVTIRLTSGGFITVWPDGTVQVSDSQGSRSANYKADTANRRLFFAGDIPL